MSHVLESQTEFDRLEFQSSLRPFHHGSDLEGFSPPADGQVLDAACGSGVVARHLARHLPRARIVGCDISAERLELARRAAGDLPNLSFEVQDLLAPTWRTDQYDAVFSRYIIQHLDRESREQALRGLLRGLKPGGLLRAVEADGYLLGIHPSPEPIPDFHAALRQVTHLIDLETGRKVPELLHRCGFRDITVRTEGMVFQPDELEDAVKLVGWALETAQPMLALMLGGEERALALRQAYSDALRSPGAVFHFNKFIVTARKP